MSTILICFKKIKLEELIIPDFQKFACTGGN